jgi:quercetin dioxygenase-like cupin family protein
MAGTDDAALSFLGKPVPAGFDLQVITIEPGAQRPFVKTDWCDALVVVEQGQVALEAESGTSWHFVPGDIVFLSGLALRALHNHGDEPVVLSAVRRMPREGCDGRR